eukprot:2999780-Prymnesium_polylepis.1
MVLSVANLRLKLQMPAVALPMYDYVVRAPSATPKEVAMAKKKQAAALQLLHQHPGKWDEMGDLEA